MANANKVVINRPDGEEVLIDLTGDSVVPETLAEGVTAHDASGKAIAGVMLVDVVRYGAQTLTDEQKAQARMNIGAATTEEVISSLEGTNAPENLLDNMTWSLGYIYSGGGNSAITESMFQEAMSGYIPVVAGEKYKFVYKAPVNRPNSMWHRIWAYNNTNTDASVGAVSQGTVSGEVIGNYEVYSAEITIPTGATFIRISGRTFCAGNDTWDSQEITNNTAEYTRMVEEAAPKVFYLYEGEANLTEATSTRILSPVSDSDDGKIMRVKDGMWEKSEFPFDEITEVLNGGSTTTNILSDSEWLGGYIASSGYFEKNAVTEGEVFSKDIIRVSSLNNYDIIYDFQVNKSPWIAVAEYGENGFISRTVLNSGGTPGAGRFVYPYTPAENVTGIRLTARTYGWTQDEAPTEATRNAFAQEFAPKCLSMVGVKIIPTRLLPVVSSSDNGRTLSVRNGEWVLSEGLDYNNPNIKAINHRGYCTEAPENTLSAYRLSKKNGFTYVECDVSFTSDGVAVLLHDNTIDRTSNGTGSISALTLAQVKAMDFGSWFSEKYAGEKIPTLEEFLILCKRIGLHPYIEIKGNISEETAANLVSLVKRHGMKGNVTWISFYQVALNSIKAADNTARLGFVTESVSEDNITIANGLKTDHNEVFIDLGHTITSDFLNLCINNDIPLEVWTVNDETTLANLDSYVSGYTSDNLLANKVLYENTMNA